MSEISMGGLRILSNPNAFMTESKVNKIKAEAERRERRRTMKTKRRAIQIARQSDRQSNISGFSAEVDSIADMLHTTHITPPTGDNNDILASIIHEDKSPVSSIVTMNDVESVVTRATNKIEEKLDKLMNQESDSFLDELVNDDLDHKIKKLKNEPCGGESSIMDKRRKEMHAFRLKLDLEEEEMLTNSGTFICVLADTIESIANFCNFHYIETEGLSQKMSEAIKNGRFTMALKQYTQTKSGAAIMKDPLSSFASTFFSIVLNNHVQHKRKHLASGRENSRIPARKKRKDKKRRKKRRLPTPPPSSSEEESSEEDVSDSDTHIDTESDVSSESEQAQMPEKRVVRSSYRLKKKGREVHEEEKNEVVVDKSGKRRVRMSQMVNNSALGRIDTAVKKMVPTMQRVKEAGEIKEEIQKKKQQAEEDIEKPMEL